MNRFVRAAASLTAALTTLGGLAACSPAKLLNVLVPKDGYQRLADIPYNSTERHRLDIYRPDGDTGVSRPVLVFFYGGSWKSGSRELYRFVGEALASAGYVVVVPDYRLYPSVQFPAFVEDAALAIRWVEEHIGAYGGDSRRVVLAGHSAGAHLAALLLLDPRYLAGAGTDRTQLCGFIGLAGPYAFDPGTYRSTRPIFATAADSRETKPVSFADADAPPMLLLHGAADGTVKPINSLTLAQRRRDVGGKADYISYPDLGHIGIVLSLAAPFRGRDAVYADVLRFLERVTASCPVDVPAALSAVSG
ncbi:MAG: alpha/beta hydrolase [Rhodospirillales bacterium]|nr:MAG: alpha/beta hydrolase [Rhodospirillales bacterium]